MHASEQKLKNRDIHTPFTSIHTTLPFAEMQKIKIPTKSSISALIILKTFLI